MSALHVGPVAPFAAHVSSDEQRALVRLIGELDVATAPHAERAIAAAEHEEAPALEVDLSSLAFMDSTGLRLILNARSRALADGRRLVLRRGPQSVQRVFEVMALTPLFEFTD